MNLYVLQLSENDNLSTAILWNNPCLVLCVNYIQTLQAEELYTLIKKYIHQKGDMIRIGEIHRQRKIPRKITSQLRPIFID